MLYIYIYMFLVYRGFHFIITHAHHLSFQWRGHPLGVLWNWTIRKLPNWNCQIIACYHDNYPPPRWINKFLAHTWGLRKQRMGSKEEVSYRSWVVWYTFGRAIEWPCRWGKAWVTSRSLPLPPRCGYSTHHIQHMIPPLPSPMQWSGRTGS